MPSTFPSSFASAAAGNSLDNARSSNSGEWSRRPNGATTFRRPSGANTLSQKTDSQPAPTSTTTAAHTSPSSSATTSNPRNGGTNDTRYSKEQLLDMFRAQRERATPQNIEELLIGGWNPQKVNGASTGGRWADDHKEANGPEICWDLNGNVQPLGLIPLTDEEKEAFSTTVNSPIKPPSQNKEGAPNTPGVNRRTSLSQQAAPTSTSSSRMTGRQRKDSTDPNNNFATSPASSRLSKEEIASPPETLLRRKTDYKEAFGPTIEDKEKEGSKASPFGPLKRATTNPIGQGLNSPSSPWAGGSDATGFTPMGAFGSFGATQHTPSERKPTFGAGRAESRFKSLMEGDNLENKKPLGRNEPTGTDSGEPMFRKIDDDEIPRTGSAALLGEDASPPPTKPLRKQDGAFQDMNAANAEGLDAQTPYRSHRQAGVGEPLSPTYTNPYQSPEGDRGVPEDIDTDDSDPHQLQYQQQHAAFARGPPSHLDRNQPNRAFQAVGSLNGLGSLNNGPWGADINPLGAPSKNFGENAFAGFGDLNPSAFNPSSGLFASAASNTSGVPAPARGSKLGPLFDQGSQNEGHRLDARETERSDSAAGRSRLEDLISESNERLRNRSNIVTPFSGEQYQRPGSASLQTPFSGQDQDGSLNQLPAPQQRQMVMPDRMKWIYRDPQGKQQGPWSGLEMHDWYKAGFFTAELQVKKLEDTEYEPLAQLIRRIGNSREPFLVPQIGIAHGPPAGPPPNNFDPTSDSVQPPFAGAFPSFGTTLTADQQNALERRKQEDQWRQAHHKDVIMQAAQSHMQRQMPPHLQQQQLHHHSSAHSLHSQPSYGSMGGPLPYQAPPNANGAVQPSSMPGQFDRSGPHVGGTGTDAGAIPEETLPGYLERLQLSQGNQPFPPGQDHFHQQQQSNINQAQQDRARLQAEQQQHDAEEEHDQQASFNAERLEEYHRLRAQENEIRLAQHQYPQDSHHEDFADRDHGEDEGPEPLSLSEQVQKAAAKQPGAPPQAAWAKAEAGMPQPFPPPQSSSPMPAPTPQRNRQSVADALNAESQAQSQSEIADAPSAAVAPWAKDATEGSKGPSLKEIQAMEAQKAARQEEVAAATRKAQAEQERQAQQQLQQAQAQTAQSGPGLPSSANWASSGSPSLPTASGATPWSKPATGKSATANSPAGSKKTLAQIQKEEEARKSRVVAAVATSGTNATKSPTPGGKRYADLAGKGAGAAQPTAPSAAWTTVGAGGKVKTAGPTTSGTPATRTASNPSIPPSTSAKPKPSTTTSSTKAVTGQASANEEFQKWARGALSKGLASNIHVDDFVSSLLHLPLEPDIISDSIYASSQTLDGRRFAEEFVRRRKLADRGLVPDSSSAAAAAAAGGEGKAGGGWSEVAKKGGNSAGSGEAGSASGAGQFKVVAGKKKGKR